MGSFDLLNRMLDINEIVGEVWPELYRNTSADYSIMCPIHGDTKESLRVYNSRNVAICYGLCNRIYSPILLFATHHGLLYERAALLLARKFPFEGFDVVARARLASVSAVREWKITPLQPDFYVGGDDYLHGRGIFVKGSLTYYYANRVYFPHFISGLHLMNTIRVFNDSFRYRREFSNSSKSLVPYGLNFIDYSIPTFVVEGPVDALSVMQLGYQAVATTKYHSSLRRFSELILMFDGDSAGRKFTSTFQKVLTNVRRVVSLPEGEDANSLLVVNKLKEYL